MKTEEDEAFEELEHKLGKKEVAAVMANLDRELETYRNEVLDELATRMENEFKIPFAQDTVASFAVWIREQKR